VMAIRPEAMLSLMLRSERIMDFSRWILVDGF
jgi:hypothetical protein